jgi:Matrixin
LSSPQNKLPIIRRIPLSVFSLRPNSHTARPPEEDPCAPVSEPGARGRWALAALGLCVAVAGTGFFLVTRAKSRNDTRLTHVESTVTGRARPKQTEGGSDLRWQNREVVVAIDDSIDELGAGSREAVQAAFASWLDSGAELPRLRFESTHGKKPSERPDGVNSVMFAPIDLDGHRKDVAITLTFSDPKTGEIVEADIVINKNHPFAVLGAPAKDAPPKHESDNDDFDDDRSDEPQNTHSMTPATGKAEGAAARSCGPAATDGAECGKVYDLENAATHEVGHFFGLGEDVEDTKTSMYQCISRCEIQKRSLETDDRQAAVDLYVGAAAGDTTAEAGGCGGAQLGGKAPARGAPVALALAVLGLGWSARRRRAR